MPFTLAQLLAYGAFGFPLALVALPVYVMVPQLYAAQLGMSLATVGTLLLAARATDAFIDPPLGRWMDGARSGGYPKFILLSLPLLAIGFAALMLPPALSPNWLVVWFGGSLMLVREKAFSNASSSMRVTPDGITTAPTHDAPNETPLLVIV
jgi:Na+/melibiose symporter-like transporter